MPDHQQIYLNEAEQYERLISHQPNLAATIESIVPYTGLDIIDLGAGTGRLACVLAEKAKSILLLDDSAAMLQVAANKLEKAGHNNWRIQTADNRVIPAADQCADLVVIGWSLCYLSSSNVPDWRHNMELVLHEIKRVLRPSGTCIIIETMGTGVETPMPYDFLQGYYAALEQEYNFSYHWIRTDYHFATLKEGEQLSRFFFGDDIADNLVQTQSIHLPECAGVWWRSF
jgi:ubiquinone/menaquinone biosynthesis C-methylase UbiE